MDFSTVTEFVCDKPFNNFIKLINSFHLSNSNNYIKNINILSFRSNMTFSLKYQAMFFFNKLVFIHENIYLYFRKGVLHRGSAYLLVQNI